MPSRPCPQEALCACALTEATDWETQRRGIAISVIDTGNGIRPEDAERLFQPFFTTKSAKGTGLGLWISKGIVQKYEGRIRFRSLHASAGRPCTCFRVFLPASAEGMPNEIRRDQDFSSGDADTRHRLNAPPIALPLLPEPRLHQSR